MKTLPPAADALGDEACERWLDRWCFTLSQLNREILLALNAALPLVMTVMLAELDRGARDLEVGRDVHCCFEHTNPGR